MDRRFVKDAKRALTVLGCDSVESIKLDRTYHVTAVKPDGKRLYLRELVDVTDAVLTLSREQTGR